MDMFYFLNSITSFLPFCLSEDTKTSSFVCRLFVRVAKVKKLWQKSLLFYFQNIHRTFSVPFLSKYYFIQIPLASRTETLSSRSSTLMLISLTVLFTVVTLLFTSVICEVKSISAVCSATMDSCTAETIIFFFLKNVIVESRKTYLQGSSKSRGGSTW